MNNTNGNIFLKILCFTALAYLFLINITWAKYNFIFSYRYMGSDNFNSIIDIFLKLKNPTAGLSISIVRSAYGHSSYPFFYFLYSNILSLISQNISMLSVIISNYLLILITALFAYKIASELKDKTSGYTAFLLTVSYPAIYGISRYAMLENMITPLTAAFIYFLIKSDNFSSLKYCLAIGITLSLGLLTKYHFLIFIAGGVALELVYYFIELPKNPTKQNLKKLANITIIAAIVAACSLPYYLNNYKEILRYFLMSYNAHGPLGGEFTPSGTLQSWFYYIFAMINYQLSLPFFLIFLTSLLTCLPKIKFKKYLHIFVWIVMPYIVLQTIDVKWARYSSGYLPACAIISGLGISKLKNKKIIAVFCVLITLFSASQNTLLSFKNTGQKPLFKTSLFKDKYYIDLDGNIYMLAYNNELREPDYKNRLAFQDIKRYISEIQRQKDIPLHLIVRDGYAYKTCSELNNYLKIYCYNNGLKYNRSFKENGLFLKNILENKVPLGPEILITRISPDEIESYYNNPADMAFNHKIFSFNFKNESIHYIIICPGLTKIP
ncbi:MAG: glycosyltransferase family 39 protein [Candidatus Omnitrophica bacterium]|nr:glycosyltransferase family 39 protein [Candidatus Omnitrophota bacterium]